MVLDKSIARRGVEAIYLRIKEERQEVIFPHSEKEQKISFKRIKHFFGISLSHRRYLKFHKDMLSVLILFLKKISF